VERGKREICWVDANLMNVVIAVYGVLFLDWNSQGNPEHKPFEGVGFPCFTLLQVDREGTWTCADIPSADPFLVLWVDGRYMDEGSGEEIRCGGDNEDGYEYEQCEMRETGEGKGHV